MSPLNALPLTDVFIRIAFALAAGLVLGLERESHGRAAGLKTTILACVASCLAMILSEDFYRETADSAGMLRPDRARLAAGILTGIGFLGAGAIIRQGTLVRGVTTAAVLWFITILGLAFGSGHIILGIIGTGIALFSLFVLPHMEQRIKKDLYASITVTLGMSGLSDGDVRKRIEGAGVRVQKVNFDYDLDKACRSLHFELKLRRNDVFQTSQKLVKELISSEGVTRVVWG